MVKGHILDFSEQTNSGVISGDDDQRYTIHGTDWMEADPPRKGMAVDFTPVGDQAWWAKAARTAYTKSKLAAGLLALFLGWLGIHKFYLGYRMPGAILLLCCTIGFVPGLLFDSVPDLFIPHFIAQIATGLLALFLGWLVIGILGYRHKSFPAGCMVGVTLLFCGMFAIILPWLLSGSVPVLLFMSHFIAQIIGPIEGIIYLTKQDDKFNEEYVVQKKPWF